MADSSVPSEWRRATIGPGDQGSIKALSKQVCRTMAEGKEDSDSDSGSYEESGHFDDDTDKHVPREWRRASVSEKQEINIHNKKKVPSEWRRASVQTGTNPNDIEGLSIDGRLRQKSRGLETDEFKNSKESVMKKMNGLDVPDGWVGLKDMNSLSEMSRESEGGTEERDGTASFAADDAKTMSMDPFERKEMERAFEESERKEKEIEKRDSGAKGEFSVEDNPYMMN